MAHICGCGFYFLGIHYIDEEVNWLKVNGLVDKFFIDKYINTLYFSIISMVTVGYGDIAP